MEFLGFDEKAKYSESELESAIIDKLEGFLLELGKGFLFEARQKRFTFDEDHSQAKIKGRKLRKIGKIFKEALLGPIGFEPITNRL